jgi:hypothetical protein
MASANSCCVNPIGLRNSSRSISPGCVGTRFVGIRTFCTLPSLSVVVYKLNFIWAYICPYKTNSILVIDADTILSRSISTQRFKTISWRYAQLIHRYYIEQPGWTLEHVPKSTRSHNHRLFQLNPARWRTAQLAPGPTP